MAHRLIVLTISLLFFLGLISTGSNRRIQQFSLYSVSNQIENFTQNIPNLEILSPSVRQNVLQSVCSQLGVWAFFTAKNYATKYSFGYHPATPDWTCNGRRIMADWMSPFRSIRHLGNSDLDTPSLSLYRESFFAAEELYFNGHEFSISGTQLNFASFGFTGRDDWTIYSSPNFRGESVCLQCKCDEVGKAIGVTYTAKLSLTAGSIRRGCFGPQVLLPNGVLDQNRTRPPLTDSPSKNFASLTLLDPESNSSLVFSGTELRLPCNKNFSAFQISRRSNWTVFSGRELNSPSACLRYEGPVNTRRGMRRINSNRESDVENMAVMVVGSIRFGCSQALIKKNSSENPIMLFVAPEKETLTLSNSLKSKNSGKNSSPLPPSRSGFGRNISPIYVPVESEAKSPNDIKATSPEPGIGSSESTMNTVSIVSIDTINENVRKLTTISIYDPTSSSTIPPTSSSPSNNQSSEDDMEETSPTVQTSWPQLTTPIPTTKDTMLSNYSSEVTSAEFILPTNPANSTSSDDSISNVPTNVSKFLLPTPATSPSTLVPPGNTSVSSSTSASTASTIERIESSNASASSITSSSSKLTETGDTSSEDLTPLDGATTLNTHMDDQSIISTTPSRVSESIMTALPITSSNTTTPQSTSTVEPLILAGSSVSNTGSRPRNPKPSTAHEHGDHEDQTQHGKIHDHDRDAGHDQKSSESGTDSNHDDYPGRKESLAVGEEAEVRRADHRPPPRKDASTIHDDSHGAGPSGMFFTAFLIIFGILVTAMLVTIAVFIYLRATRSAEADME